MKRLDARPRTLRTALAAAAAAVLLAGCFGGGGGDDDNNAGNGGGGGGGGNTPPASASASTEGFLAFVASLANGMFDSAEPFDLSGFTLPTDDADRREPIATAIDAGA